MRWTRSLSFAEEDCHVHPSAMPRQQLEADFAPTEEMCDNMKLPDDGTFGGANGDGGEAGPRSSDDLFDELFEVLQVSSLPFAIFYRSCFGSRKVNSMSRQRNLLPLPLVADMGSPAILRLANLAVIGLNYLNDNSLGLESALPPSHATTAQLCAIELVVTKCARLIQRLDNERDSETTRMSPAEAFQDVAAGSAVAYSPLVAADVDLPTVACNCDPTANMPSLLASRLRDPAHIFPNGVPVNLPAARSSNASRDEYAVLSARMLRCGKARLRLKVHCAASTFTIGKKGSTKLREVWAGDRISAAATRPPKPRRLGNPAVFMWIIKKLDRPLYYSKRDAKAYFDQLKLPYLLRPFFGRPRVRAGFLADAMRLPLRELESFVDDLGEHRLLDDDYVVPVCTTWPMGFSWSSFVAQEEMVSICRTAGFCEEQLLALDCPHPLDQTEMATVATDDVIFIHDDERAAHKRLDEFDRAMVSHDVERNTTKDINAAEQILALGCTLGNDPPWVEPEITKLRFCLSAIVGLLQTPMLSPRAFAALLGIAQWFAQITRCMYSIFDAVYAFQRLEPQDRPLRVDSHALDELLLFAALSPLLPADLEREFTPLLTACDASPSFGFGVSVRSCDAGLIEYLATLSERNGDFIRTDEADNADEKYRVGEPIKLPFSKDSFTDVLSVRAKMLQHSGAMEAHAVLLLVQWALRSASRFNRRLLVLIDAKAVLYAVLKGRSSAPTLKPVMRRIAAHCLAGGLLLYPLYVPSENNPADGPSRGLRRRPQVRRKVAKEKITGKMLRYRQGVQRGIEGSPYRDELRELIGDDFDEPWATLPFHR